MLTRRRHGNDAAALSVS